MKAFLPPALKECLATSCPTQQNQRAACSQQVSDNSKWKIFLPKILRWFGKTPYFGEQHMDNTSVTRFQLELEHFWIHPPQGQCIWMKWTFFPNSSRELEHFAQYNGHESVHLWPATQLAQRFSQRYRLAEATGNVQLDWEMQEVVCG